jgi:hypothetical protein
MKNERSRIRRGARCVRQCLGIVVTIISVACAPPPEQARMSVDYYRAHVEERDAKLAECTNDPGGMGATADCKNAKQAAQLESIGSQRDLPSLGLPTQPANTGEEPSR